MKLSVVCSEDLLHLLPQLRNTLDGLFVETLTWFNTEIHNSEEYFDKLDRCLGYSSYVLCIVNSTDFDSPWINYVMGFQRGHVDRLAFLVSPENRRQVPDWVARYQLIVGDCQDVFEYYAAVEEDWNEETKSVLARRAINDRNLEVSARAYIESVQKGDRFLLGLFLDSGFSPSLKDAAGVPVLNIAIRNGHTELIGALLSAGADLNGIAEDRDTTPLMDVAAGGYSDLTEALINAGAELEHISRDGQSAVTLAVGNRRDEAALVLIRAGADVDRLDLLGMSARKYAELYKQEAILAAIAEKMSDNNGSSNP